MPMTFPDNSKSTSEKEIEDEEQAHEETEAAGGDLGNAESGEAIASPDDVKTQEKASCLEPESCEAPLYEVAGAPKTPTTSYNACNLRRRYRIASPTSASVHRRRELWPVGSPASPQGLLDSDSDEDLAELAAAEREAYLETVAAADLEAMAVADLEASAAADLEAYPEASAAADREAYPEASSAADLEVSAAADPEAGAAADLEAGNYCDEEYDVIFNRNKAVIGRVALKCLRVVSHSPGDEDRVLSTIHRMSTDDNPDVRTDLMEYVPNMAMFCHSENLLHVLEDHIISWVLTCMLDENRMVRNAAQLALLVLVERALISSTCVAEKVCPAVLHLPCKVGWNPDIDFVTGIVKLICRMARLLGPDTSVRLFLETFCSLARHHSLYIRQVCASSFVEFAMVVPQSTVESILLPLLLDLCEDIDCMVRKACAVIALSMSCMISMEARKNILTPSFLKLLSDKEREVRKEAYCSLGPFICTFAVPSMTNLVYNSNGVPVLITRDGCEFRLTGCDLDIDCLVGNIPFHPRDLIGVRFLRFSKSLNGVFPTTHRWCRSLGSILPMPTDSNCADIFYYFSDEGDGDVQENREDSFNTFQFWRDPIPECPLGPGIEDKSTKCSNHTDQDLQDENWCSPNSSLASCNPSIRVTGRSTPAQDVMPQVVLDAFLSMAVLDEENLYMEDTADDYAHLCAYNIPAVALTLGRTNWPCLRQTYELLSQNSNPHVRRTMASSMHEIASIVGESVAANELLPIFHRMMYDEDRVKIAALRIVSKFLEALPETDRMAMLPRMSEFTRMDNDGDWRTREEWALQIVELVSVYDTVDVAFYIKPFALELLQDRVAQVRNSAIAAVIELLVKMMSNKDLLKQLCKELVDGFARDNRWENRQSFGRLCSRVFETFKLDTDFVRNFLPFLYELSGDLVPNVRMAGARALSTLLIQLNNCLPSDIIPIDRDEVAAVLVRLQSDVDPDVRSCASIVHDEADQ